MSLSHAEVGRLQKKVAKYVWLLRDECWLGRWEINVRLEDLDGSLASVEPANHRHFAEFTIHVSAAATGGESLRHTIVHELLHLYHRDSNDIIRLNLPNLLSHEGYKVLWESYRQAFELMIDDLATVWAPNLPLPPWGNE